LSWRAIEATCRDGGPLLGAFIHVPLLAREGTSRQKGLERVTPDELVDAGEAMLMEMVKLTRASTREQSR
jgi:pyroglutamyl-peptidase